MASSSSSYTTFQKAAQDLDTVLHHLDDLRLTANWPDSARVIADSLLTIEIPPSQSLPEGSFSKAYPNEWANIQAFLASLKPWECSDPSLIDSALSYIFRCKSLFNVISIWDHLIPVCLNASVANATILYVDFSHLSDNRRLIHYGSRDCAFARPHVGNAAKSSAISGTASLLMMVPYSGPRMLCSLIAHANH